MKGTVFTASKGKCPTCGHPVKNDGDTKCLHMSSPELFTVNEDGLMERDQ